MDIITEQELAAALIDSRPAMLRRAYGILRNTADAEDAVGDAVLKALENRTQLRRTGAARAWLLRITANTAKNMIRKNSRIELIGSGIIADCADSGADTVADPYEREMLRRAVDELPEPYRDAIRLYYYEGQSVRQIAKRLRVSEGTVKSRLSRGRGQLAAKLGAALSMLLLAAGLVFGAVYGCIDGGAVSGLMAENKVESGTEISDHTAYDSEYRLIKFVEDATEVTSGDICYVAGTRTLYLPSRALTTDEVAEIERLRRAEGGLTEITETVTPESPQSRAPEQAVPKQDSGRLTKSYVTTEAAYDAAESGSEPIETGGSDAGVWTAVYDEGWEQTIDIPEQENGQEERTYMLGSTEVDRETYEYYCSDIVPTDERAALEAQPAEWYEWKAQIEAENEAARIAWESRLAKATGEAAEADTKAEIEDVPTETTADEVDATVETNAADSTAEPATTNPADPTAATDAKPADPRIARLPLSEAAAERLRVGEALSRISAQNLAVGLGGGEAELPVLYQINVQSVSCDEATDCNIFKEENNYEYSECNDEHTGLQPLYGTEPVAP